MKKFEIKEPFNSGYLEVSKKHKIYFEQVGNPKGHPIVFVHGGPGGGISKESRVFFDPEFYNIVLFDQRGAGKSEPFACMDENTTWDLISDMEKLREHLKIDKWIVFGGSWGSTLSLIYSINHSDRVKGLILRGIFLARKEDVDWLFQEGCSYIYPDAFEKFKNHIKEEKRNDLLKAYYELLMSDDKDEAIKAAKVWSVYEGSVINLVPDEKVINSFGDDNNALALARTECHYFYNNSFLEDDNYIINNIDKIKDIKTIIVHGRYDVDCRLIGAYELNKRLNNSKLIITKMAGHSSFESENMKELIEATEEFKRLY